MIAIIKYNAGNIRSVENALQRLDYQCQITDNPVKLRQADKVIFPGVGEAASAMRYLKEKGLDQLIPRLEQPVLGICLGLQLLCNFTEEGNTKCLGVFDTYVKRFPPDKKVPHIGWNNFTKVKGKLFQDIAKQADMYYVHSYYAEINSQTIGICDYVLPFASAIKHRNFYATQFHPEKSADIGAKLLKNFLQL